MDHDGVDFIFSRCGRQKLGVITFHGTAHVVACYSEEIRRENPARRVKTVPPLEQEHEDILCNLFSDLGRAAHVQRKAIHGSLTPAIQDGESAFIAS